LPGLPYDGHTLARVLPELESQIGVSLQRVVADARYKFRLLLNGPRLMWLQIWFALSPPIYMDQEAVGV